MALPTLRGTSPWDLLREMRERMDDLFESGPASLARATEWTPPVNIEDLGKELRLTAELPGMTKDDIEVELENNVLTIRGEKKVEREERKEGRVFLYERKHGSFVRSFTLPQTVRSDEIEAHFADGVLTITMPKTEEAKSKKIAIQ